MPAQYWTTTGYDMWRMEERTVFELKNLLTGEVITCRDISEVSKHQFAPVTMPKIKRAGTKKRRKRKRQSKRQTKVRKSKSKYKGVYKAKTPGKFRTQFWDGEKQKVINLGTFDNELLAAAAYQEHIGNLKEAQRLRNEYQEGDCRPEAEEESVSHIAMFPSEQ